MRGMRGEKERRAARLRSLRTSARAYELRARGEADPVKKGGLLRKRDAEQRRADKVAQEMEEKS